MLPMYQSVSLHLDSYYASCLYLPLPANFERGGHMNVAGNQGTRPNYMSTLSRLGLYNRTYTLDSHQQWTVCALFPRSRRVISRSIL